MIRLRPQDRSFAAALAAVAGYVDTIGFLKAGGFFVSFMSGNSTRLAVGLVRGSPSAPTAAGLIGAFVLGVMVGTAVNGEGRRCTRWVLLIVASLLAMAALMDETGFGALSIFVAAAAMGAENATFAHEGEGPIGLTYMTGTLVKVGQRLVQVLQGKTGTGWFWFLLLWAALVSGGVLGALAYGAAGFRGLWPAVFALVALSFYLPGTRPKNAV